MTLDELGHLQLLRHGRVIQGPELELLLQRTYDLWSCPKATRDYWGVNVALEKKFSHNWQGGLNYTLSKVEGNYSGLASSDEVSGGTGRLGPNVELYYDDWFIMYDASGKVLSGSLPQDRTHYLKGYGSYTFPFGLTLGVVAYGRSGLPLTTKLLLNDRYIYPENRANLGRLPFAFWADFYAEYTYKFGDKYRASINFQMNNITSTSTIQSRIQELNLDGIAVPYQQILDGTLAREYQQMVVDAGDTNHGYDMWATRFNPWSMRLGLKFSF